MKCLRLECMNEACVFPVISFTPKDIMTDARAEFVLKLFVCSEHATGDASQYVSDAGWLLIVAALEKANRACPDRESLQVRYEPIA